MGHDGNAGELHPGMRVEVRSRYEGRWVRGFALADITPRGFHVTRVSDGEVLPAEFVSEELREDSRGAGNGR